MGGLHTGEETGTGTSGALLGHGQVVEFTARVRFASRVLIFGEDTNTSEIN